ncbi:MAG: hypothetical protein ABJH68_05860 [Ilumatobacter sp.]|uniref:hypothetical protein n=1 Tax=Ilumatobacter sp. TaxID=1967498 RepID=UPI003299D744
MFQIDGWDIDTDRLEHLRKLLPIDSLGGFDRESDGDSGNGLLHPKAVLQRDNVRLLVISDRNTVGLCGPSRSGTHWDPIRNGNSLGNGQQRFANFIRNMGRATDDVGKGDGGSYGVGKSALWMASECGTILVHTRTTDSAGEPVERFIGSVHGEFFVHGDQQFTGRHFIGAQAEGDIIEPIVGARAAAAAGGLPLPSYTHDGEPVDGTSIVIVAPRLHLGWEIEMNRLRDAVRWHVWPKRVPGVRDTMAGADMDFRIHWNNHQVDLPAPLDDPEIRPYAKALLDCARERNSDEADRDLVAECHRPKKVLGTAKFRSGGSHDQNVFHLTLTDEELETVRPDGFQDGDEIDDEPAVDFGVPWGQMALIRREPLLLVKYEPINGPDAAATDVGVFLSADDPEVEGALTKAEPPAHDDWIHKIVPKEHTRDHRRTFAKRTVEEIKRARKQLIGSYRSADAGERGGGEQLVSRLISDGLLGGLGGGGAPKPPSKPGKAPTRKPRADLTVVKSYRVAKDMVHELDVLLGGIGEKPMSISLTAAGSGHDNTGTMPVDGLVTFSWISDSGTSQPGDHFSTTGVDGARLGLVVHVRGDVRFRPKVKVEITDAS